MYTLILVNYPYDDTCTDTGMSIVFIQQDGDECHVSRIHRCPLLLTSLYDFISK